MPKVKRYDLWFRYSDGRYLCDHHIEIEATSKKVARDLAKGMVGRRENCRWLYRVDEIRAEVQNAE